MGELGARRMIEVLGAIIRLGMIAVGLLGLTLLLSLL